MPIGVLLEYVADIRVILATALVTYGYSRLVSPFPDMPNDDSKSLDLLGVKPVGEAIKIGTEATFKAAGEFLSRICLPAAEEFGLLLRDRVSHWRAAQANKIAQRAEAKVAKFTRGPVHAHPRLVFEALDTGSWSDDDVIQDAWAGILASSCTEDGKDDSNVVFASLLSQLTGVQLRILNYSVEACDKYASKTGLPYTETILIPLDKLMQISGCVDAQRLDRELDHLRALELIGTGIDGGGGFYLDDGITEATLDASIQVSALALHLYVRGQGFVGSPVDYFGLTLKPEKKAVAGDATVPSTGVH